MKTKIEVNTFKASGKWYMNNIIEVETGDRDNLFAIREKVENTIKEKLSTRDGMSHVIIDCELIEYPMMIK